MNIASSPLTSSLVSSGPGPGRDPVSPAERIHIPAAHSKNVPAEPPKHSSALPPKHFSAPSPSLAEQLRILELRRQTKRARREEKREEANLRRQAEKVRREDAALRLAHIRRVAAYRHELYEEKRRASERQELMRELDSMSVEEFYQSLQSPAILAAGRQIVRVRSRLRLRYRRMAKEKGRPPLRQLPCRKPTWGEICANAVSALWDQGRPNRNLLKSLFGY